MFDFIKDTYKKGDKLKLICINGEFAGEILVIGGDSIILKTFEGKTCGIKGTDITFFEELSMGVGQTTQISTAQDTPEEVISRQKASQVQSQNTPEPQKDEQHIIENPKSGQPKYKPGDVIPLEELHRIDPKVAQSKIKRNTKTTQKFNDLRDLNVLVEEEHAIQNDKFVPAIGEVKRIWSDRNYGFIRDGKTGKDVFFSFNQIIDSSIDKTSGSMLHTPVIYSIQGSELGDSAITIHRPNKVKNLILLAHKLLDLNDFKHAVRILDHILNEYPENFDAKELKETIEKAHSNTKSKNYSSKAKRGFDLYNQAKACHLAKDYSQAIEYYTQAIKAGEKLEVSIKDLGMLYAQLYKLGGNNANDYREKTLVLIHNHEKDLPDTISTLYYLENLYYSIKDFEQFVKTAKKLLETPEFLKDKSRSSHLLCKIAAAYIQDGKIEQAKDTIEEVLSYDNNHQGALKLKSAIESDNQDEIIEAIFLTTEFESYTSGLSPFIQQTLDGYNEYAGVTAKIKEKGNFSQKTLQEVRDIIDTFIGRAKDRAPYLLTEAKLMLDIEPENIIRLRTILARYCYDMAKTHIADNSPLDVIRFYYNEAFSLEENYDNNAQNVAYYILTHIYDYRELLQITTRNISVDAALGQVFKTNVDVKGWINILSMFLYNRTITANVTSLFYLKGDYKLKTINALAHLGIQINPNPSKEEFTEAWNSAREKLMSYNNRVIASIRAILKTSNLEEMYQQLLSLNDINKEWMFALDVIRLNTIINNIGTAISAYLKSSGYRNKEANRNNANGQIQQLKEEINKAPTKLSYEEFLPLLDSIEQLLAESFSEVIRLSEPRISINLLSEQTVLNDSGIVNIQVEVGNHKDSSPIKEVSLALDENNSNIKLINADNTLYNAIEGGESHIFKLQLEVGKDIIVQKATAVTIYCNYINGGDKKQVSNQISLKLYSQDEFTPIDNPYAPIADGGPVPLDSKMFYGRETEIENIVDAIIKSPSKQIIIYGQKRSGKSSVMLHLKQSLLDTGKTFCVFFSLGEILNNLNETSFYYKILDSIKQELDFLEMSGKQVPLFEIPSIKKFKEEDEENPLNTFSKYMIKFKMLCKQTEGWENKNLVVMIDEFTYLYSGIKKGSIDPSIMKQWKAVTQNERAQFSVVLVGQDVVPSFKKEDYARNAFGVIQDMRLTYLKDEPARALIEKPILDENGHSRYIGDAVSRIIEWTSRNPYYIQIFCSRLVDFMNNNKSISVTEADVNEVARSFIDGSDALEEDKFDNLIRAGESEDLQEYAEEDILSVLHQIALQSKNIGYCNRADIDILADKRKEDAIINDLCNREVLETKSDNNYKIQVKLFQEWLLKH